MNGLCGHQFVIVRHGEQNVASCRFPHLMRDFAQFGFTDVLFPGVAAAED